MKKRLLKFIGLTFALALVLNIMSTQFGETENPPLFGTNTITQSHIG